MKVPDAPFAMDAMDAGLGPVNAPIVAVPPLVRADGVTVFIALPVPLVTVIVKVAVLPE